MVGVAIERIGAWRQCGDESGLGCVGEVWGLAVGDKLKQEDTNKANNYTNWTHTYTHTILNTFAASTVASMVAGASGSLLGLQSAQYERQGPGHLAPRVC